MTVLLAAVSFATLPFYAQSLAAHVLKKHGISLISLDTAYPGFRSTVVHGISAEDNSGNRIFIDRVSLGYSLFGNRMLDDSPINDSALDTAPLSITIDKVTLWLADSGLEDKQGEPSEPDSSVVDIVNFLPEYWLAKIPPFDLRVQRIHTNSAVFDISSIEVHSRATELRGVFSTVWPGLSGEAADSDNIDVTFKLTRENTFESNATLQNPHKGDHTSPLGSLDIAFNQSEGQLNAEIKLNIEKYLLSYYLTPLSPEHPLVDGKLNIDVLFSTPKRQKLSLFEASNISSRISIDGSASFSDGKLLSTSSEVITHLDESIWDIHLNGKNGSILYLSSLEDDVKHEALASITKPFTISGKFIDQTSLDTNNLVSGHHVLPPTFNFGFDYSATSGGLTIDYQADKIPLANLVVSNIKTYNSPEKVATIAYDFDISGAPGQLLNTFPVAGLSVENANLILQGHATHTALHSQIKFKDENIFTAKMVKFNDINLSKITLTPPRETMTVAHSKKNFDLRGINLTAARLKSENYSVESINHTMDASFSENALSLKLAGKPMELLTQASSIYIPPMHVEAHIQQENGEIDSATFKLLNACNDNLLNGSLETIHNDASLPLTNDLNRLSISWQRTFTPNATFRQWLNTSQAPVDFSGGTLKGLIVVGLSGAIPIIEDIEISLRDANGISAAGDMSGVQLRLSSLPLPSLESAEDRNYTAPHSEKAKDNSLYMSATIKKINIGTELSAFDVAAHAWSTSNDNTVISLDHAEAKAFGGLASIRPTRWKLGEDLAMTIQLNTLDLNSLIETQQVEGLFANGNISGALPIYYSAGTLNLGDGTLSSENGGNIRYSSAIGDSENINEQLKLTLAVLKNFNYKKLDTHIEFKDDTLQLDSAISGSNPDVANGRQVDLNLNTEIGLRSAFKAMRIQSGLNALLEKHFTYKAKPSDITLYCQPKH
ncbi:MAG: hypothetical protein ACJA0N_001948 [Pseudohongiellaceae bacterium]|jgi:hypothetical protein